MPVVTAMGNESREHVPKAEGHRIYTSLFHRSLTLAPAGEYHQ